MQRCDVCSMLPIIKVEGLRKSFNENLVLDGVDLEIGEGEKLSLVGSSGCGKTVLAKHFNGLLQADMGRVTVFGKDMDRMTDRDLDDVRRRIGYVFQGNALFASDIGMDVYANVSIPLRMDPYDLPARNEPQIEARTVEVLEQVGLGRELLHRQAGELSGGQRKRVAVARAIVARPPVVIYDEPTTGLDPETGEMVIDLIERLHDENHITTIAITHDKMLMARLGRVVYLRDRKVYFDGSYDDFNHSADESIQRFLAQFKISPPRLLRKSA